MTNSELIKDCKEVCDKTANMFVAYQIDKSSVNENHITEVVRCWETLSRMLNDALISGDVDPWAVGNLIRMYYVICSEISKEMLRTNNNEEFESIVFLMGRIEEYFDNWPLDKPEQRKIIRDEFARGDYKTFGV